MNANLKVAARVANQNERYADARFNCLEDQINHLQAEILKNQKASSKTKMIFHFIFIASGLGISALLIKLDVNQYLAVTVPGLPSFIMEVIDKIKML